MTDDNLRGQTGDESKEPSSIPETATTMSTQSSENSLREERIRYIYNSLTTQAEHIDRMSKYQLFLALLLFGDIILTLGIAYTVFL